MIARRRLLTDILPWLGVAVIACAVPAAGGESGPVTPYSGQAFETRHSGVFNGEPVEYRARFSDTVLRDARGRPTASLFATSYLRADSIDPAERPVIFVWNGGPSAASQTLHMAGLGPRRLVIPAEVAEGAGAPWRSVDNTDTLLDVADLVFVDPVETGFSRILPAGDRAWFFSSNGDAESIAQFILAWLSENDREESAVYVLGTSYGSIRAVLVAGVLAESRKPLDGAILFSQGVNLVETTQRKNNIVGYASNLSQQAAIAWYHGRTSFQEESVYDLIDRVEDFAMGEYLVALGKGQRLSDAAQRQIAGKLAGYTGIPRRDWLERSLRMTKAEFRGLLLEDQGRVLGANDARYTAVEGDEDGPPNPTAGVADVHRLHMEDFLGVTLPLDEYRPFAEDAFAEWSWNGTSTLGGGEAPPGALRTIFADFDYPGALIAAFAANDDFRVLIATGIYDTLTTVGPARLLAAHVDYPGSRVRLEEYRGGHAFYSNDEDFARLAADLRTFVSP